MIIAIDGPAGSGKSTIARMLARRLGFNYLDTGAMYRALTWKALQDGADLTDANALCQLMDQTAIEFRGKNDGMQIWVDGVNVTEKIRAPSVTNNVHYISNASSVRHRMVKLQQMFASGGNVIAEGRDMGTVVFPHADKKFFLDAEIEERARRRHDEMRLPDGEISYADVMKDIEIRDKRDTTRDNSPLRKSDDAIYLNTTKMSIEEVVARIFEELEPVVKKLDVYKE
ncbi:MAG: (d)CMP kinase [Candidatus Brocadia sp.]|uniref:Cytidylate kinase n=1 Tax=Candidatus Brocadia fulgida TaxID=380242 RepID=A0A0M2UVV0_9BACT|nr:MAG: cytidylate kinase [Candidatus Brocadia fulgida]MCC6324739.1 (d)CMP kinase [Candidatus Brocadia sp.]MCE7910549.1 (d)CMP kinase [Candidatus Brocadia sp. AMX3]OQZ00963.1 MAG: cytidylate kinase [Candidatus Brocadia sp. UTAMX2]MDG5996705.1 (d)CMP kinase [Candidatus Brocadia sp.]